MTDKIITAMKIATWTMMFMILAIMINSAYLYTIGEMNLEIWAMITVICGLFVGIYFGLYAKKDWNTLMRKNNHD